MTHIDFVIWMIGYPLVNAVDKYVMFIAGMELDESTRGVTSLIVLAIWGFVGWLLY